MKTRIITGVIFAAFGIPVILLSDTWLFPVAIALFTLLSVVEILRVFGLNKSFIVAIPSYILAVLLPFFAYKSFEGFFAGIFGMPGSFSYMMFCALVFFVYLLYMAFASVLMRGKLSVNDIAMAFMAVVYLLTSFVSYVLLRNIEHSGFYLFIMVLVISWGCDISAYFIGTLVGKHKLIPEVSPKKTVEGAIGGIICSAGLTMLFGFLVSLFDKGVEPQYLTLAIIGLVLSVVSQFGDLWASIIKRQYGVKDFGNFFPGHGGALDRFDSVLAICLLLLLISIWFNPFVAVAV